MTVPFQEKLRDTAEALHSGMNRTHRGLIGFDGFVDEIIDVVATRRGPEEYERIATMTEFGKRIEEAAGLSTNMELVPTQVKLGGNGPIMSNALVSLGFDITYIGSVGYPKIHPVFEEFAQVCRVISIAEPGHTHACEFNDGKVMLGNVESLKDVRWRRILSRISTEELQTATGEAALVAALNWTMIPYLTEVWEHFLDEILTPLPGHIRPIAFFDLCDPAKREDSEIRAAVRVIERFSAKTQPILGLNRKEATEVADALGLNVPPGNREAPLTEITRALGEALDVYAVVVHPTAEAAVYMESHVHRVAGPYTNRPKLTTGAGDNFNAGFCLGQVLKLDPEASLILGKGTSGFYVRNRRSPTEDELAAFLHLWAEHEGEDF